MKRFPSKIAVSNVCAGISGQQYIMIYDYDTEYDLAFRRNGSLVCDGKLDRVFNNNMFSKYFDSEYHGMTVSNGAVVFHIFTKYEDYK